MPFVNIQIMKGHPAVACRRTRWRAASPRRSARLAEYCRPGLPNRCSTRSAAEGLGHVGSTRVSELKKQAAKTRPVHRLSAGGCPDLWMDKVQRGGRRSRHAPWKNIVIRFLFTEGPLWWHAAEKYLLFSDMPGDHLRRWRGVATASPRSASRARSPTGLPSTGWYLLGHRRARQRDQPGHAHRGRRSSTIIASHHGEKELNSPNRATWRWRDLTATYTSTSPRARWPQGRPPATLSRRWKVDFRGDTHRATPDGALTLLADDSASRTACASGATSGCCCQLILMPYHIRVFDFGAHARCRTPASLPKTKAHFAGAP